MRIYETVETHFRTQFILACSLGLNVGFIVAVLMI